MLYDKCTNATVSDSVQVSDYYKTYMCNIHVRAVLWEVALIHNVAVDCFVLDLHASRPIRNKIYVFRHVHLQYYLLILYS